MFNAFNTIRHARDGGPSETAYNFIVNTVKQDQTLNTLIRSSFEWATNESFPFCVFANRFSANKLESECNYVSKENIIHDSQPEKTLINSDYVLNLFQ